MNNNTISNNKHETVSIHTGEMTPDAKECFQTQRDWSLKILKIETKAYFICSIRKKNYIQSRTQTKLYFKTKYLIFMAI